MTIISKSQGQFLSNKKLKQINEKKKKRIPAIKHAI